MFTRPRLGGTDFSPAPTSDDFKHLDTSTPLHTAPKLTYRASRMAPHMESTPSHPDTEQSHRKQDLFDSSVQRYSSYYSVASATPLTKLKAWTPKQVVPYKTNKARPEGSDSERSRWYHHLGNPRIPYVALLYLQLLVNVAMVAATFYAVYKIYATVHKDVGHKMALYVSDVQHEISRCLREFQRNKCSLMRSPALEQPCLEWEKCMARDPQQLGRLQITAETVAEILDGFLRPISWKAVILMATLVLACVVVTNVAFGAYRRNSGFAEYSERCAALEALQIKVAHEREMSVYALGMEAIDTDSPLHGKGNRE